MSTSAVASQDWTRVGSVPAKALTDARLQLHHAAQIIVSAAISYIPARSDDSHTAMSWSAPFRALVTEPITNAGDLRIGLRVEDLTLLALRGGKAIGSTSLTGKTIVEGNSWLAEIAREANLDAKFLTSRKHYAIPEHAVAAGATFSAPIDELVELSRYWANAAAFLAELARVTTGASPVRTWPHHFDIATLIELPGSPRRTVGVGQSPGDDSYAEPYWYVGPYPYPAVADLPPLDGSGHWHTTGWVGGALPATDYADAIDQRAQVAAFVDSAVKACRRLLGA